MAILSLLVLVPASGCRERAMGVEYLGSNEALGLFLE
jgi:hypothetical protein